MPTPLYFTVEQLTALNGAKTRAETATRFRPGEVGAYAEFYGLVRDLGGIDEPKDLRMMFHTSKSCDPLSIGGAYAAENKFFKVLRRVEQGQ